MKRSTIWYWTSFTFSDPDNQKIGIQLSQHVYDDAKGHSLENAIWINDKVVLFDEILTFHIPSDPLNDPWRIQSPSLDLKFTPLGAYQQYDCVPKFICIDLLHTYGRIQGTLFLNGKTINIDTLGTVEDHKSLW